MALDLAKIYRAAEQIKGMRSRNALTEMQLEGEGRKQALEVERNALAQQFLSPKAQGGLDRGGYANALLQKGDFQGAEAVQAEEASKEEAEMEKVKSILAINPKKGVDMWNKGVFGKKYGAMEYKGLKGSQQIFKGKDGEITAVDKNTLEVKQVRAGKEPEPDIKREDALKRISSINGSINKLKNAKASETDKIFAILSMSNPDLADAFGSGPQDEQARQDAINALVEERKFLQPFSKGKTSGKITKEEAMAYLEQAGGDKEQARILARADGRTF